MPAKPKAKNVIKRATRIQSKTGMSSHAALGLAVKRAKEYQQGFGLPNQPGAGTDARTLSRGVASGEITSGQRRKTMATLTRRSHGRNSFLGPAGPRKSGFVGMSATQVVGMAKDMRTQARAKAASKMLYGGVLGKLR